MLTYLTPYLMSLMWYDCRSQWLRCLTRRSAAARLLRLWVRIPSGTWMSSFCERCLCSGRGLCDELITRIEKTYRMWCAWLWSRNLVNEEAMSHGGCCGKKVEWLTVYSIVVWLTIYSKVVWLTVYIKVVWLTVYSKAVWLTVYSKVVWLTVYSKAVWLTVYSKVVWLTDYSKAVWLTVYSKVVWLTVF